MASGMRDQRFPYERAGWASNPEEAKRWFEELEKVGPRNVRAVLAQTAGSSGAAISIGSVPVMTLGFAQEWLAWHDQKREVVEEQRHNLDVYRTRLAALGAIVAAAAAVIGCAWSIFHR
jgi:hypothetical protein